MVEGAVGSRASVRTDVRRREGFIGSAFNPVEPTGRTGESIAVGFPLEDELSIDDADRRGSAALGLVGTLASTNGSI